MATSSLETGRLSRASLDEAYAPRTESPRNLASFVTLGDSRTMLNGRVSEPASVQGVIGTDNRGYVAQAMVMLRHRIRWIENGGVGGDTTEMMLARLDPLLSRKPGWLIGMGAINSTNGDVPATQIIAELTEIFNRCASAGVRVVWGTDWISGGTNTVGKRAAAATVNSWLRKQATTRPNFYLADYASVMGDTETGIIPVSLGADQLHQDAPGAYLMGKELFKVLNPLLPPSDRLLSYNADPTNYLTNGMFTGDVSGLGTGWGKGSSTAVASKVARIDGLPGSWQQLVCSNETVTSLTRQITLSTTDLVEGDLVYSDIEFETDAALWAATEFTLQLQTIGGAAASATNPKVVNDMLTAAANSTVVIPRIESGILRTPPLRLTPAVTHLQWSIRFKGTGTYRVSRGRITKP